MTPEELHARLSECGLVDSVFDCFDLEILAETVPPEDEFGHLAYSAECTCFGVDGSGGQFLLIEDGSVGYWGCEGQLGRIADSLEQCIKLIVGVPNWMDLFGDGELFEDEESLDEFIEDGQGDETEQMKLCRAQVVAALELAMPDNERALLWEFYRSATREPQFGGTYTEDDGETYPVGGSLLDYE